MGKFVILLLCFAFVNSLIHDLEIENDNRKKFFIENFGFEANGILEMKVLNFKVDLINCKVKIRRLVAIRIKKITTAKLAFLSNVRRQTPQPLLKRQQPLLTKIVSLL